MKRWIFYPQKDKEREALSAALGLPPLLSQVLVNRGIVEKSQAEAFLSPKLGLLKDPFDIPDIQRAAERLLLAKNRGEKVLIYGDYDVDGVTGTAILFQTLKLLGVEVSYYIPHRHSEGYSLSLESVEKIAAMGVKLILTVDCGISNVKEIVAARSLGMEVVVTDHHNLPECLPEAYAIVNPKRIEGEHPSRHLSGAGVAFKFAWALLRAAGKKENAFLTSLLDLAGLGTLADVVPLTGENRILAVAGLNLLNERKRVGLRHLCESASLHGKISVNQVNFGLSPRINAAGRLEHASKAVDLLLAEEAPLAKDLADELSRINTRRQDIGTEIKEAVFARIDKAFAAENKLLLLAGENWHPGVIGIVASKVVDAFSRPAVLIGLRDGVGRGSARSVDGINIFELLNSCRDLFTNFGGHEGAAGFEIVASNIPELEKRLKKVADEKISAEDLEDSIKVDMEIHPSQITLGLIKTFEKLQPFGEGNPPPVFVLQGLQLADFKKVGGDGRHLKAWLVKDDIRLETIGFGFGKQENGAPQMVIGNTYDIAFNLESNTYNGFESAQLSLVDIRENKLGGRA